MPKINYIAAVIATAGILGIGALIEEENKPKEVEKLQSQECIRLNSKDIYDLVCHYDKVLEFNKIEIERGSKISVYENIINSQCYKINPNIDCKKSIDDHPELVFPETYFNKNEPDETDFINPLGR